MSLSQCSINATDGSDCGLPEERCEPFQLLDTSHVQSCENTRSHRISLFIWKLYNMRQVLSWSCDSKSRTSVIGILLYVVAEVPFVHFSFAVFMFLRLYRRVLSYGPSSRCSFRALLFERNRDGTVKLKRTRLIHASIVYGRAENNAHEQIWSRPWRNIDSTIRHTLSSRLSPPWLVPIIASLFLLPATATSFFVSWEVYPSCLPPFPYSFSHLTSGVEHGEGDETAVFTIACNTREN